MSCGDDMKTLLSRHVDGELSSEERVQVEEHVAGCAPCRELLEIFQKNESLLSNALSTESFGNTVIESVIEEIKRDGMPLEAKPVEEGPGEWFRSRPLVQFAAAALFIAGLVAILSISHNRQLSTLQIRLEEAKVQIHSISVSQQDQARMAAARNDEYEKLIRALRIEDALRHAPERWMLGYVESAQHHLVVRSSFDPKTFGSFHVLRRGENEGDDRYVRVSGERRLTSPEYVDASVKPGRGYVYKFRAFRSEKEEDFIESFPIVMRVPEVTELAPEKSIRVQCENIAVNKQIAIFTLHRVVSGQAVSERFYVKPGDRVGELRQIPGLGRVDFRTDLVLDRLEESNQTLAVSLTRPVLDREGKPVIERFVEGTAQVAVQQHDEVLSVRPNMRACFRPVGSTPGPADVDLWKGSWMQVRAQD